MKIITNLKYLHRQFKAPVVALGIFDGVHLGHKKIFKEVIKEAKCLSGASVAVTFNPHPRRVLDMIGAPPLLVSLKHRLALMEMEGLDVAVVLDFNKDLAGYSAEEFVKKILVNKIGARQVIVGANFKFGKDKTGDINFLRYAGQRFGFSVKGVRLHKVGSLPVSSSRIRSMITSGRLKEASGLLGRPVSILGTVTSGSRRGRTLGYRTANVNPHHEAIPAGGVYAVYVLIGRKTYKGILNIGCRPTFQKRSRLPGDDATVIEVHIFGFNKDIYGRDIEVIFVKRLRAEKKFPNKEILVKQIKIDERKAHMIL